jgi:hypothetical protein
MDVGRVNAFEASCVVPDDPGEVVRGARPLTPEDASRLREQMIARLVAQASPANTMVLRPRVVTEVSERVRLAMAGWRPGIRVDEVEGPNK